MYYVLFLIFLFVWLFVLSVLLFMFLPFIDLILVFFHDAYKMLYLFPYYWLNCLYHGHILNTLDEKVFHRQVSALIGGHWV